MATHELTTKSAHESIISDSRGRSTVTRRLAMNMLVSTAIAGTIMPSQAGTPDPIFAAIDAHKVTKAAFCSVLHEASALEEAIPLTLRQSFIDPEDMLIVETDDPRWIENTRQVHRLSDAETDAACALVSVKPTTMAGVIALLQYAVAADTDGHCWPTDLQDDDGKKIRSWQHFLIEAVADTLPDLLAAD